MNKSLKILMVGICGGIIGSIIILFTIDKGQDSSIVAEWFSAIGTVGAVWFSLWTVSKEEKVNMSYYMNYPDLEKLSTETMMSWPLSNSFNREERLCILCVANKSTVNVQLKISIRIIDTEKKLEVNRESFYNQFDEKIFKEFDYYEDIETGYRNISSGTVIPLIIFNSEIMHTLSNINNYEIQLNMDYLDKGYEIVNISSRTGDLVILHGKHTDVDYGEQLINLNV